MGVRKKPGRGWVAEVYAGRDGAGKKVWLSRSAETKREALQLEAKMRLEVAATGRRPAPRRTVADLMAAWLDSGVWSATTRYGYELVVKREILPALGTVKLSELRADRLDALYRQMRDRGLSGRSVQRVHAILRAALGRAVKWGWLTVNPALNATPGPAHGNKGRVASLAEVEALLAAAEPDLAFAIRLAAVTGARRSELAGLRWSDVDFEAGTVAISRAVVDAGGQQFEQGTKSHAERKLPLDPVTLELLRSRRGIGPVLGASPRVLSNRLAALCAQLGITGLGWHSFRHWSATTLLGSHDARTVANRLGHANPNVTLAVYAHALAERDRAAGDALGAALGR